jgi:hypothetical protein
MKLGTAFATQGLLSDGLDNLVVRPTFCDTQNDLVVAEGVKEACIGCIPWPAVDHEVESAAGSLISERDKMIGAEMLSDEPLKSGLTKCHEFIGRDAGWQGSTKTGIVDEQVRGQTAPQGGPILLVKSTAEFMDSAHYISVIVLVQHRLANR